MSGGSPPSFRETMNSSKILTVATFLSLSVAAVAATSFTEDFSGFNSGSSLGVKGGNLVDIDFSAGTARFTGDDTTGAERAYLGTNMNFDLGVDFVAEVGVSIPGTGGGNNVAFFGFGAGQRGVSAPGGPSPGAPSYYEPSEGPAAYVALIGDSFSPPNARKIAYADFGTGVTEGTANNLYKSGGVDVLLGSGIHRMRMTYTAANQQLEFAYQAGSLGSFVALGPAISIANNGFSTTTGQLFFGGSGNIAFDNVSLVVPEPGNAVLLSVVFIGALLRRRRQ